MNVSSAIANSRQRTAAAKKQVKYDQDVGYLKTYGYWPGQEPAAAAPATPSWVDGTSSPGLPTVGRRAPITPLPGAILVQDPAVPEDAASLETKSQRPLAGGSNRAVVDRTTGQVRREVDDEELRRGGAILLR